MNNLTGDEAEADEQRVRREWQQDVQSPARAHGAATPQLRICQCPYRNILPPLVSEIERLKKEYPPERLIAVVVPDVIETRWWQLLLHRRKPARLRSALLKLGDPRLIVVNVPWYLKD